MKIQNLENGIVKLLPDEGKILIYKLNKNQYSEAITSRPELFTEQ